MTTHLYIKQHAITGKLYFGKTERDVISYLGSGKYWKDHIKKHGKEHVVTLWYERFENKDELIEFALSFSKELNIVESSSWLNLCEETGISGIPKGYKFIYRKPHSEETKIKIGLSSSGRTHTIESNEKNRLSHLGKKFTEEQRKSMALSRIGHYVSEETKNKIRLANLGVIRDKSPCTVCGKLVGPGAGHRFHFKNCKNDVQEST
jgi:hypothetical protein